MQPKNYGDIFLPELLKNSLPRTPKLNHTSIYPTHPGPHPAGAQGVGGEGSSSLPPPLGHQMLKKGLTGEPLAVPSAISTSASAPPTRAEGKFGGSRPPAPASPQLQHQLQAAARAGLCFTHLPTGRGRRLLRSARRGSGARISGRSGLCCSALQRASYLGWVEGGGSRRGTVHPGVAGPGGRSAEARVPGTGAWSW